MPIQSAYTLNANEIYSSLANLFIGQFINGVNLEKHTGLVDKARRDGGLFGDTLLFYETQVLTSSEWKGDLESSELLATNRPKDPNVQAITLNKFRKVWITLDQYLTKRAWMDMGAFSKFTSVMLSQLGETKMLYENTYYNTYIGNAKSNVGKQSQTWNLTSGKEGQDIAKNIADLLVEMGDYSKDFNDLGYMRSFAPENIKVIWNSKFVNLIEKVYTPTIFHDTPLKDKLSEDILPARYFGRAIVIADDVGSGKVIKSNGEIDSTHGTVRSLIETEFTFEGSKVHFFPGDKLPSGVKVSYTGGSVANPDIDEKEVYIEDGDVICKVVTDLPILCSSFTTSTEFINPRSLTSTTFLIWGFNDLKYFQGKPFITIKKSA